jgi:two-component system, OmpR family, sensor histidine kinase QseC
MKWVPSLRLRITVLLVSAVALSLGAATRVIDARVDNEALRRLDGNILESAQALSEMFRDQRNGVAEGFPSNTLPGFLATEGHVYFTLTCDGKRMAASPSADTLRWRSASTAEPTFTDMSDSVGTLLRAVVMPFSMKLHDGSHASTSTWSEATHKPADSASACTLGLAVERSHTDSFLDSIDAILVGSIIFVMLVVGILTPLLVTRGLRPLAQLADAMHEIGPKTPGQRLSTVIAHELKPLIARFNEVLSRMEDGLIRERQFASGVAHELRTPLAELRTLIEVELRYPSPSERGPRALLEEIGNIGHEMEHTVGALLLLTRIEGGIEQVQLRLVDVTALTLKFVERYANVVQSRKLKLDLTGVAMTSWFAENSLLDVLIGNLLNNAFAYAPIGSLVSIHCSATSWWIDNLAPDVAPDELALMRQRFWRKGQDSSEHTGLGLSLAAAAARVQDMELTLSLHRNHLRATVSLRSEPEVHNRYVIR